MLQSLLNKFADPQACNFVRERFEHNCFPVRFAKFLKHLFLQITSSGCFFPLYKIFHSKRGLTPKAVDSRCLNSKMHTKMRAMESLFL